MYVRVTENEFLTRSEVLHLMGLSRSSGQGWFARLIKRGEFPTPVTRGGGRGTQSLWHRPDVEAWLKARSTGDRIELNGIAYLSTEGIARQTGRSLRTIRHWIATKKLPKPDWQFRQRDGLYRFWKEETLQSLGILDDGQE